MYVCLKIYFLIFTRQTSATVDYNGAHLSQRRAKKLYVGSTHLSMEDERSLLIASRQKGENIRENSERFMLKIVKKKLS